MAEGGRDAVLSAIRERNAAYRTFTSLSQENQFLADEVERLRSQLHSLEQQHLLEASRSRRQNAETPGAGDDVLQNDALRLSPMLWPRLAFGALQRLTTTQPADFRSAVEAVCATAQDWSEHLPSNDPECASLVHSSAGRETCTERPECGEEQSLAVRAHAPFAKRLLTLEDVVAEFATHIVRSMLLSGDRVDLVCLREREEEFRRLLLEVCCTHAVSNVDVSRELAEMDRKKPAKMPSMRTLMSEELIETHEKLALAEQAAFSSQAELLESYRTLASSGKEVASVRKQLVAVQGDLLKARRELHEEVAFFRQVQEENRVQAAIIKSHGPHLQQMTGELCALKEERAALKRKVLDLEDLVVALHASNLSQARAAVSLAQLARTATDRLSVVMARRAHETRSLESLVSLALTAKPPSPADGAHVVSLAQGYQELTQTDADDIIWPNRDTAHAPREPPEAADVASCCHSEGEMEAAADSLLGVSEMPRQAAALGGMEGWAREALEEAVSDLRRLVQDVELDGGAEAQALGSVLVSVEEQLAHYQAATQHLCAPHCCSAATLARVLADHGSRTAQGPAALASPSPQGTANGVWSPDAVLTPTEQAGSTPLQPRGHRSFSLGGEADPLRGRADRNSSFSGGEHDPDLVLSHARQASEGKGKAAGSARKRGGSGAESHPDSPGSAGGIGMSFSTGHDGCFYITGLRPGSPAALCGLLQVGDMVTRVGQVVLRPPSRSGTGASTSLLQSDVANMLRGPVGSVLSMHVRRSQRKDHRSRRPSSGGFSPLPALASAGDDEPSCGHTGDVVGDAEDTRFEGLEIEVCLTRVGLASFPPTPSPSASRRAHGLRRGLDAEPKRLSWNSLGATAK